MTASIFKILAEIFRQEKISCILIGGYAINAYKVTRHTADIDFMLSKESFNAIMNHLFKLGYSIANQQDVFVQLTNTIGFRDLDFVFADPDTIDMFLKSGNKTSIASEEFIVPSLEHLIALKLHSIKYNAHRELIDLPDIINLIRINKLDYNKPEFRTLCEKFGTIEIYNKIITYLTDEK